MRCLSVLCLVAIMAVVMIDPASARQSDVKQKFVGNWRLVSTVPGPEGTPPAPNGFTAGRIMYDAAGNMAAQLNRGGRSKYAAQQPTDAERAAAYGAYVAYFGRYDVDPVKGIVTHHVESSLNSNWPGTDLVRWYKFSDDGNRLTLQVRSGDRVTSTLVWERIK